MPVGILTVSSLRTQEQFLEKLTAACERVRSRAGRSKRHQQKGPAASEPRPGPWHSLQGNERKMNGTKSRKSVKPASGSCRWAVQPTETHPGVLVINGQPTEFTLSTAATA